MYLLQTQLTHTVFPGEGGRLNERPGGHNLQISVPRNSFETHFFRVQTIIMSSFDSAFLRDQALI